jgi:predicted transcriptional regulator
LSDRLAKQHGVRVVVDSSEADVFMPHRRYDVRHRMLRLSPHLQPGQRAFQMATQLAFLEAGDLIHRLAQEAVFSSDEARSLAHI